MEKRTNFETVGFYESVTAVFGGPGTPKKAVEIDNFYEEKGPIKFGDVIKECKAAGWTGESTILLLLESYLNGEIYRYGNYGDEYWYPVGTMCGFA